MGGAFVAVAVDGVRGEHVRVSGRRVQVRDRAAGEGAAGSEEEVLPAETQGATEQVGPGAIVTRGDIEPYY